MKTERRKKTVILVFSLLLISGITWSMRLVNQISLPGLRLPLICLVNLLNGVVALVAMKLSKIKMDLDFKNKKQYLIGFGIALALSFLIAFLPAICGFSLVGGHTEFNLFNFLFQFLFLFLIIGPVEELIFRIYVQDVFTSFFTKSKWLGVIMAAALFGLWHIINGSLIQTLVTFGIGLVWGMARCFIKNLKLPGLALSHGTYDFLNVVVTVFIVK